VVCCDGLQSCLGNRKGYYHYLCLSTCETPTTTTTTTTNDPHAIDVYKLLTFNTWWGNRNYNAIAELIGDINPQITNLQEAIEETAAEVVDDLNRLSHGNETWALANPWSAEWYWCGLTAYRSDLWDLEWHKEVGIKQDWDTRGVCGSLLRRKSDGHKVCVWGTHPIWRDGSSHWAQDAIRQASSAMKECSDKGAPSVFMCDCNTHDTWAVRNELESSTGAGWELAMGHGYDQIYVETNPKDVGTYFEGDATCGNCGQSGCQAACSNPEWAYSDHPPVYVSIDTVHESSAKEVESSVEEVQKELAARISNSSNSSKL